METDFIEINIKNILEESLKRFYSSDDRNLLSLSGTERSCVFRIGIHINDLIKERNLTKYKLDSEYNKCFEKRKEDENGRQIRPDLIIHKRMEKENIIAIEFKGYWNKKGIKSDIQKLSAFTNKKLGYCYKLGALVVLEKEKYNIIYFKDSKKSN